MIAFSFWKSLTRSSMVHVPYEGGPKKNKNYLLEGGPFVARASPTRWVFQEPICIIVPAGIVLRGCVWLQRNFFEDPFNTFAQLMIGDLRAPLPTPHWVFSSFWPQTVWPPCPIIPIHQISPQAAVLFFWMKKFLKEKHCANVEEVGKMAETVQGIKINKFKNCFEQ